MEVIVSTPPSGNRAVANHGVAHAGEARDAAFSFALNPVGPIEQYLVDELGRRAAESRDYDVAREALRREGEAAFSSVLSTGDGDLVSARNLALASVLASERHEALMRQGLASTRGFLRALHVFREVRATGRELGTASLLVPDPRFATEQACSVYLVRRYFQGTDVGRSRRAASLRPGPAGSVLAATRKPVFAMVPAWNTQRYR